MPPRPFPYPLKVGIDVCYIARIRDILTKNVGKEVNESKPLSQFLSKVMTWPERQFFWDRFKDNESAYKDINKVAQYLAGRWAAKEACRKACSHMGLSNGHHKIMILPESGDRYEHGASFAPKGLILHELITSYHPSKDLDPEKREGVWYKTTRRHHFDANEVDGQFCEVSISHDERFATAVAMVPIIRLEWEEKMGSGWGQLDNGGGNLNRAGGDIELRSSLHSDEPSFAPLSSKDLYSKDTLLKRIARLERGVSDLISRDEKKPSIRKVKSRSIRKVNSPGSSKAS
ncbi:uncharacterized protein BDR25DRAFT_339686 [Lindgomyces ingoldianus]|uniref:Uncharacterized protein n=1 Tax=Lindgomyces ingoldianus TaxID=673940 RepID=A0ACB6R8Q5_9PLEO|nr:uncharacterized protein BDR25DRAFT_339686 [Lindgomyces ingoldianus]KAF2475629.1 hypothetical protein BDR25DRAFT_339686 [Lindgomyces ingoldianus]